MSDRCNEHIIRALDLSKQLISLADKGDYDRQDDSCGVLYGVIRDCAYKIRAQAEKERDLHTAKGMWMGQNLNNDDCQEVKR